MKKNKLDNNSFEKDLKKAVENFEMQPSGEVWEGIHKKIHPSKKGLYVLWRGVAAAVILLLMGVSGYFLFFSETHDSSSEGKVVFIKPSFPVKENEKGKGTTDQSLHQEDNHPSEVKRKKESYPKERKQTTSHKLVTKQENSGSEQFMATDKKESLAENISQQEQSIRPLSDLSKKGFIISIGHNRFSPQLQYPEEMIQDLLESKRGALLAAHNKDRTRGKLSFGAYLTTGVSYRTLKETNGNRNSRSGFSQNAIISETSSQERESRNTKKVPLQHKQDVGWNAGLSMGIPLSKKFILKTGLSVQRTEYKITAYKYVPRNQRLSFQRRQNILRTTPLSTHANTSDNNNQQLVMMNTENDAKNTEIGLKNQYLNAEIPLLIGYRFGHPEKVSFTVTAGAGITYLLNAHAVDYDRQLEHYYPNSTGENLRNLNSNLIFNINVGVPLSNHLQFEIGPSLQYQLLSSYKAEKPVADFPYLIGLKTKIQLQ